jgi:hypothetical protein
MNDLRVPAAAILIALACCAPLIASAAEGRLMATDQFIYRYGTTTQREVLENWLDASWEQGGLRAGVLLDHQAPSEEGFRTNEVRHRFFAIARPGLDLRVGHFYGLFGRGLLFAAREDRRLRVDTALDGLIASGRRGAWRGTVFSGAPSALSVDVRGGDAEVALGRGWALGASGLTWRPDDIVRTDGSVHREWVAAPRVSATLPFGGAYVEYGWKKGWDFEPVADDAFQRGHAFYGSVQLFGGPFALVAEADDYDRFAVLRSADGRTPLNEPPALTLDHLYPLLNRAPHAVNADDERGRHVELTWAGVSGWSALLDGSRIEKHDGTRIFEEAYGQLDQERIGAFRLRGALGYRESEGLRQSAVAEVSWLIDSRRSLGLEAEHQHVRMGGGPGFDLGAYDEEYFKLEWATAPAWSVAAMLEVNDKYPDQRAFGEKAGPFPAAQVSYTNSQGAVLSLWAGRRQSGYLCAGGVCKYEPAFDGLELTGTVRY